LQEVWGFLEYQKRFRLCPITIVVSPRVERRNQRIASLPPKLKLTWLYLSEFASNDEEYSCRSSRQDEPPSPRRAGVLIEALALDGRKEPLPGAIQGISILGFCTPRTDPSKDREAENRSEKYVPPLDHKVSP